MPTARQPAPPGLSGEIVALVRRMERETRSFHKVKRRMAILRPRDFRSRQPPEQALAEIKRLRAAGKKLSRQAARLTEATRDRGLAGLATGAEASAAAFVRAVDAVGELARVQGIRIRSGVLADVGVTRREVLAELTGSRKSLARHLRRGRRLESLWLAQLTEVERMAPDLPAAAMLTATLDAVWSGMERAYEVVAGRSPKSLLRLPDPGLIELDFRVVEGLLCEVRRATARAGDSVDVSSIELQVQRCERAIELAGEVIEFLKPRGERERTSRYLRVIPRFQSAYARAEELRTT